MEAFSMTSITKDFELCQNIVEEELLALEAIYPEYVSRLDASAQLGSLIKVELPITLGSERLLQMLPELTLPPVEGGVSASTVAASPSDESVSISRLPSLIVDMHLPPSYPLYGPPIIISMHFVHSWLPSSLIPLLLRHFHDLWVEQRDLGEGTLWRIAQVILDGSFLDTVLHLSDSSNIIKLIHPAPRALIPLLRSYDAEMKNASFAGATFFCSICLRTRKGAACVRLSCDHVFCKSCIRHGWGMAVGEGDISQVRCPDTDCASAISKRNSDGPGVSGIPDNREAREEDVRRVLTEEEVKRWKWLREKRDTDRDPSIVHCPLQFCQAPVRPPASATVNAPGNEFSTYTTGWFKLRTCEGCGYSFCVFCRRSWHGPISPCDPRTHSTILREHLDLPESSSRKRLLERMLGKQNLSRMITQFQEEENNQKLIERSTTACPKCRVRCEKSHGCNHMHCTRCGQHYCHKCGDPLNPKNPYPHFSERRSKCYGKLFDQHDIAMQNEWDPFDVAFE